MTRPGDITAALGVVRAGGRPIAGGATLVAMMNAGLVTPDRLVALKSIPELRRFQRRADGTAVIGATRTHHETAELSEFDSGQRVVALAAGQIANPVVRNMGTMGGSIAFSDPAADYPAALVAAQAEVEITGASGARMVPAAEFFTDWYTTALNEGELVTAVHLPPGPAGAGAAYRKLAKTHGDLAVCSVAIVLAGSAQHLTHLSVAVGGCGPAPLTAPDEAAAMVGGPLDPGLDALTAALVTQADPPDDVRGSADYRLRIIPRMVKAAIADALREVGGD